MSTPPLLSVDAAVAAILERATPLPACSVALGEALGLILAEPVVADMDLPPFTKALMDGYAVRSSDLAAEGEHRLRVVAEITAGQTSNRLIASGEAARIMTGAPLPPGTDAVVPVERTRPGAADPSLVELTLTAPVAAGQFRLDRGRELRAGELLLDPGTTIRGGMVGLIGSAGRATIRVVPRPSVAIIPTGDELVAVAQTPGPGQIRNTNGPMLAALARAWGARDVVESPAMADDRDGLVAAFVAELAERDVLIVSGGVSAGVLDLVPAALVRAGVEPVFHKVAVKPGKPLWFGFGPPRSAGRAGALVFGLPGNPASGVVGFLLFVRPALDVLAGRGATTGVEPRRLGVGFSHRGDRPTFHPVRVEAGQLHPLRWAGSADLRTVALADGFAAFAAGDHEYAAGDEVGYLPFP